MSLAGWGVCGGRNTVVETLVRTARMRSFSASYWPSGILPRFIYPWFLLRLIFRIKTSKNKLVTFSRISLHLFFGCLAHASNVSLQAVCIAKGSKPSVYTWEQTKMSPVVCTQSHRHDIAQIIWWHLLRSTRGKSDRFHKGLWTIMAPLTDHVLNFLTHELCTGWFPILIGLISHFLMSTCKLRPWVWLVLLNCATQKVVCVEGGTTFFRVFLMVPAMT